MKIKYFLILATVLIFTLITFSNPSLVKSSDEIFSVWQTSISLPYAIANFPSFIYSNRIYAINGSAQTGASKISVISSLINQDGSLVSWNNINADTPDALIFHASASIENRVYVLGGKIEPSGIGNSVNYAWVGNLNNDGSISGWTDLTLTPLPKKLSKGKAVIVNNRIYFVGGATWTDSGGPEISDSVYYADVNTDGTIGDWQTSASSLPTPLSGHGLIEANGKIITIGGSTDPGETPINKTYSATVNAGGTLSSWTEGATLSAALRDGGVIKIGSYAIYVGGVSVGGQLSNKVYYSAIDDSGNLGAWTQSTNNLPITHCCGSLAVWYNRLYLSGGWNGSNYLNSVYTASTTAVAPPPPPTPSPLYDLIVEDIKQYSDPWGDDVYDTAANWSLNPTIKRWGCALTSASMVLKYHGFSNADPKVLNTWLISQSNGYLRNGLLNWMAVSRYTFLNKSDSSRTLEYRRIAPTNVNLINELENNRPAILKEPGHFIVAKSQTSDSFGINDPAYADRTTLASYDNTFSAINSYLPTDTNLSYILLAIDGENTIKVYEPNGTEIIGFTFTEEPLIDDVGGSEKSGEILTIFQYPIPADGEYKIEVTGPLGSYTLDSYLYDIDGLVTTDSYQGLIKDGQVDTFSLSFGGESQSTVPIVTIDSLIDDLDNSYQQGLITKKVIYFSLRNQLLMVKKLLSRKMTRTAKNYLSLIKKEIKRYTPKFIKPPASEVLLFNIKILTDSL